MKKILIPVDSSEYAKRAVEQGKAMATTFGSDVVLLYVVGHVVDSPRFGSIPNVAPVVDPADPIVGHEKQGAEKMLNVYKEYFGDIKGKVETIVLYGYVADEIINYIDTKDVDFVIMGFHGIGSALYPSLLSSVTSKVLHHSRKPVLVIK